MQKHIKLIKDELSPFYTKDEIWSFIRIILNFLGYSQTQILSEANMLLAAEKSVQISLFLEELKNQKPIQYILGETEFFGLTFKLNNSVLIPRPETEELVEWILQDNSKIQRELDILDIGTGSGCIALSLAKNIPSAHVSALDVSEKALLVAQQNAHELNLPVKFIQADIFDKQLQLQKQDIIVSNPPYIRNSEKKLMQTNVLDYEPHTALFVPDTDALLFYREIGILAKKILKPKGILYFEINEMLASETIALMKNIGFSYVELRKDMQKKDRMLKVSGV